MRRPAFGVDGAGRRAAALWVTLALALGPALYRPAGGGEVAEIRLPKPVVTRLDNGLELHVFSRPRLPIVHLQLLVPAGAAAESTGQEGLATLTAQLLRQGTSRRDAASFARAAERLGGTLSSSVSRDYATASGAFLARDFEAGVVLLSGAVVDPVFDDQAVRRARAQMERSLAQLHQGAAATADEQIWMLALAGHPYGHTSFGTPGSLRRLTPEQVRGFHRDHYRPDRAVLVVAGDVAPERALAAVKEHFLAWTGPGVATPTAGPPAALASTRIRLVDMPAASGVEIRIGIPLPGRHSPDDLPLSLAASLLDPGLRANIVTLRDGGLFTLAATAPPESAAIAIGRLRAGLRRFVQHPPDEVRLEPARRLARQSFPMPLETLAGLAGQWLAVDFLGFPPDYLERVPERIGGVRATEIAGAARRWLDPEHVAIVAVGPASTLRPLLASLGPLEVVDLAAEATGAAAVDTLAATPEREARAQAVLHQALQAHGGLERLRGILDSSLRAEVTFISQGREIEGEMRQVRKEPLKFRLETEVGPLQSTQVVDGERAWSLDAQGNAVEADSTSRAALCAGFASDVAHLLMAAAAPGTRVVYRGTDRVERQDADALDVRLEDGERRRYFFEVRSHLLVAMDQDEPGRNGEVVVARRLYRDYQPAGGIPWPRGEERRLGERTSMKLWVREVRVNAGVSDSTFVPPRRVPIPTAR